MEHFLAALEFLFGAAVLIGGLAIIRSGKLGLKRFMAGVCLLAGAIVMVIGAGDWVQAGTQPTQIQKADSIAPVSATTEPVSDATAQAVVPETPDQIEADFKSCLPGKDPTLRQAPDTLDCSTLDCSSPETLMATFDGIVDDFGAVEQCIPNDKLSLPNIPMQIFAFKAARDVCKQNADYVRRVLKRLQDTSDQLGDGDEARKLRLTGGLNGTLHHPTESGRRCAAYVTSYHNFSR